MFKSLINLFADTTPHQMKRIGNGRQDVQHLLPKTWKILQEHNDQVNCITLFVSIWQ